jgi:hypothetical protein
MSFFSVWRKYELLKYRTFELLNEKLILDQTMRVQNKIIIEVAAFTPNAALAAYKAGADRIELCSGYAEGGLSPSAATIMWVREKVPLPLHVMIRPRIGDFVYNEAEKEIMLRDIQFCKDHNINGIVAGALMKEGEIDIDLQWKWWKRLIPCLSLSTGPSIYAIIFRLHSKA